MARYRKPRSDIDEQTLEELATPLRDAYIRRPDPSTERSHVAQMAAAARQAPASAAEQTVGPLARFRARLVPAGRPAGRRLAPVAASTVAAFVASLGITSGLAVAGVSLPDQARAPFKVVGITLPNQADDAARDALMRPKPIGSERDGADSGSTAPSRSEDPDARSRAADPPGSRETGRERSQPGRDTARERSESERGRAPAPKPSTPPAAPRGAPQGAPPSAQQEAPRGGARSERAEPPAPSPAPRRGPGDDGASSRSGAPQTAPSNSGRGPGNRSQGGTQ